MEDELHISIPFSNLTQDEKRAALLLTVLRLKREYNRLSIIFRLPNEVLCLIFCYLKWSRYCLRLYRKQPRSYHVEGGLWHRETTHVCHAWRQVALETTSLWRDILVSGSEDRMIEYVRRSRTAPLDVFASFSGSSWGITKNISRLLREAAQRIRKLELYEVPSSDTLPNIFSCYPVETGRKMSLPTLEDLKIGVEYEPWHMPSSGFLTDFIACSPALKKLYLRNCFIDWEDNSLLRNLSHFSFSLDRSIPTPNQNVAYNAILQMPFVEHIDLGIDTLPFPISPLNPMVQPVELPKLRNITVCTRSMRWLSAMLSSIACSQLQMVSLVISPDEDTWDWEALLLIIFCTMQQVQKYSSDRCSINLSCRPNHFQLVAAVDSLTPLGWDVLISVWGLHPPQDTVELLNGVVQRINLQNLESLGLNMPGIGAKTWASLFGNLPHLHTLRCYSAYYLTGLTTITEPMNQGSASLMSYPFQVLKTMEINEPEGEDYAKLITVLRERSRQKLRLEMLRIRFLRREYSNNWYPLQLDELKEVVESIVVGR